MKSSNARARQPGHCKETGSAENQGEHIVKDITAANPTGVESFDHRALAHLPEYHAAQKALDDLVHAMNRDEVAFGQQRWLETVRQMAASLGYADCCSRCRDGEMYWPFAADVKDGWLQGRYRCLKGHSWKCGYAVDAPAILDGV